MMKYVLFPDDPSGPDDRRSLGGKAAAFHALRETGTAIPEWFVVTPRAFADSAAMARDGSQPTAGDAGTFAPITPSALVIAEIEQAIAKLELDGSLLAVRSSAADEDHVEHSFAGQFESYLSVPAGEVPEKLAAVWRSAADRRVVTYRAERGLALAQAAPAVIVQRMVEADAAGVAFSADPVSGRRDLCLVSAVRGLGDQLVAGRREGDTFDVDGDGRIVRRRLANASASLSDEQVRRVAELARQMQGHFGRPQDIEWAFAKGALYLLQSRAITGLPAKPKWAGDTARLWDNSNIVESYSGVTTPLTFSFARTAYEGVYRQFVRIMGVPRARIVENDAIFGNMLGLVGGRVYYNLLNWYRLLLLLPGFAVNRRFMEQMMGVGKALPADLVAQVLPDREDDWRAKLADALRLAASLTAMVKNRVLLRRKNAAFYRRLDEALAEPSPPLAELSLEGLVRLYGDLHGRLLTRWDAPLINDFFCMIAFGLLGSLLRKVCGADAEAQRNRLLAGQGRMISAEPVQWIHDMAAMAASDGDLVRVLAEGTPAEAQAALTRRPELDRRYRDYLKHFEGRCYGELKLESPTLREDPLPLLRAIGSCAAVQQAGKAPASDDRASSEALLAQHLEGRPVWRWLINRVSAEAGARIRDRENLRFERTRVFGRGRQIFVQVGERLHAGGVIADPRDVFYLEVDEILGFVEGTATSARLGELARLRRAEFGTFEDAPPPPPRFRTSGAVLGAGAVEPDGNNACGDGLPADERQGTGCCAGVVRGIVRVVRDPHAATLRSGEILVAEFTDPGWVTLFSRAAGLLVERGSLLSHSAIVAREMGIPAIVSLPGITSWLKDGEYVEMNGATGRVTRLGQAAQDAIAAA